MDSCFALIEARHTVHVVKICNASQRANANKLQNDPFAISSSVPWTHLRPETCVATSRVSERKETKVSSRYGTWYSERVILQFMCAGLAGITYLRYTVLTSSNKRKTAVHCCDPTLSVLVMLVSWNVFHVVSALQPIVFIHFFWLIRSFVDPTLAALIVYSPMQFNSHLY